MKDRILIIEDEKELSNAITTILELNGFEVFAAGSGLECMLLLNSQDVDLVLCDINLPDITGHDILEYVRSDKRLYRLPFIFLTAYAESVDVRNGMNAGADDYLTKPFLAKDVLAAINSRLSLKRKTGKFFTDDLNRSWLAFFNDNFKQEFVTPLNSIMNATYLIESHMGKAEAEGFDEITNAIYVSSFRMLRNTSNLIAYAMLTNHKVLPNAEFYDPIFVSDIVQQVIDYYNNGITYNDKPITAELDFIPVCIGAKEYLNIVFTELIDNAVRYDIFRDPPAVRLAISGSGFQFSVKNAVAMDFTLSVDDISPFRKFHPDTSLNGIGLGLYVSRELCARLGYAFTISVRDGFIEFAVSSDK